VLGTLVLLDSYLGSQSGAMTDVIYISDLIQQGDLRGYDFTDYARGKTLQQCRENLGHDLDPVLHHREAFKTTRIHLVPIGLDAILRGSGKKTGPAVRNSDEIKAFWQREVFGGFFQIPAEQVQVFQGDIEGALKASGL